MMIRTLLAFAVTFTAATTAHAADFLLSTRMSGGAIVAIEGIIEHGDEYKFASITAGKQNLTVALRGPGGALDTAMFIGRMIRQRNYTTMVPANAVCTSSCAYMWIAGIERQVFEGAEVGFHGAFYKQGQDLVVTSDGNALLGAYIAEMGLGPTAIVYLTHPAPREMQWLTKEDARKIGLSYDIIALPARASSLSAVMLSPHTWREPRAKPAD